MPDKISTESVTLDAEPYRPRRRPLAETIDAVRQLYDVPAARFVRASPDSKSDLRQVQTQKTNRSRSPSTHSNADSGLPTTSAVSRPARHVKTHQVSKAQDDDTPSDLRRLEKGWREQRRNRLLEPAPGFRLEKENCFAEGNRADQEQEQEQKQVARTKDVIAQSRGGLLSIPPRKIGPPRHDRRHRSRSYASLSSAFPHDEYNKIPLRSRTRTDDYTTINNTRIDQKPNVRFSSSPPSILPTPPSTPPPPPPPPPHPVPRQTTHVATHAIPPPQVRDLAGRRLQGRSPRYRSASPPLRQNADTGRSDLPSASSPQSPSNRAALPQSVRLKTPYPPETDAVKRPATRSHYDLRAGVPSVTSPASKLKPMPASKLNLILAYPLPPTPRPALISKGCKDLIYIYPPASPLELSLYLRGGRVINVSKGGQKAVFTHSGKREYADENEDVRTKYTRVLRLADCGMWSKEEKRDWENLIGVVESFKRITPRIRLYHPLGHLTITCSSPPDVILTFQLESPPTPRTADPNTVVDGIGALDAAQAPPRLGNSGSRGLPSVEADSNPQGPPRLSLSWAEETCGGDLLKVRIRYSRSSNQLRIDTYCSFCATDAVKNAPKCHKYEYDEKWTLATSANHGRGGVIDPERYRTKRVVPLDCIAFHTSDIPLPSAPPLSSPSLLATKRRQDTSTGSRALQQAAATDPDSSSAGHIDLGYTSLFHGLRSDLRGWREEEREALRRLWELREEWLRWG